MTLQELKNSILQLAIQGKLVEQRAEEGTAAELVEKIAHAETRRRGGKLGEGKDGLKHLPKAALTLRGTLSALSASPRESIPDDEKPFDIPESWEWVRLGDAFDIEMGQSPDGASVSEVAGGLEFHQGKIFFGEKYLKQSPQRTTAPTKIAEPNSVLLCVRAPVGKVNITSRRICIGRGLCSVLPLAGMDVDFVYYLLAAFETTFVRHATGTTFVAITGKVVKMFPIPLPPLAEQKRIVAKIEELLPLIDRYEKAWSKLEDFNKRFPVDMQKSLLQMAIQGKLVDQRPEEGTGEELYRQIQDEKQRLIKSGKIKKEKPLPEIAEDEIPFEIPESWKWVRWGDLSQSIQYGYNAPAQTKGRIKMVRISDIQDGEVLWDKVPYCEIKDDDIPTYLLRVNDILFARTGGTVGKSYLVKEVPEESIYAGYLIRTRYSSSLCPEYLKCFMGSLFYWSQLRVGTIATAQPNCNGKTLSKMILPLPPLAEQKRIVAKLEELLPLCERLK